MLNERTRCREERLGALDVRATGSLLGGGSQSTKAF